MDVTKKCGAGLVNLVLDRNLTNLTRVGRVGVQDLTKV